MRKSRFTEEQMVKIRREADRAPIGEVAKKHGLSDQTIYLGHGGLTQVNRPPDYPGRFILLSAGRVVAMQHPSWQAHRAGSASSSASPQGYGPGLPPAAP